MKTRFECLVAESASMNLLRSFTLGLTSFPFAIFLATNPVLTDVPSVEVLVDFKLLQMVFSAFCETQPSASIGWVALSSVFVRSLFVPHPLHLLSSPLYDVSDHTNHIFSVRIWSWQHVSVNICWVEPSLLLSSLVSFPDRHSFCFWASWTNNLDCDMLSKS